VFSDYINKLVSEELPDYRFMALFSYWAWTVTMGASLALTAASAGLAAVIDKEQYMGWGKTLLVLIPILSAFSSGLLHLYKFREKEALRETGRIELEDIIACARILYSNSKTEDEYMVNFHSVRERFKVLEVTQHGMDISLRKDGLSKHEHSRL